MSRPTTVLGNYSRGFSRITSFSRRISGIARSAELTSQTINGVARSAELASFSRRITGVARSAELTSQTINGVARSAELASFSRRTSGIARSAELTSQTINGVARSAELASFSRRISGIARSAELTSQTINGVARSAELASFSRRITGVARSAELTSQTINGVARSAELASFSRRISGIAHSAELTSQTINGVVRSAELASFSRRISGIARSAELTSQTINGVARSAELASLLGRKSSDILAPFRERARFEEAEWFPHSTFPRHLLNWNGHEAYSDEIVLTYYRENWSTVCQVIEKELSECHVDRDAKEAVRQALIAHENGLYRLVPPSLFAAIERAVRVCLYDDKVGSISVKNRLVSLLGRLPISVLPGGTLAFVGFTQLSDHLYENIHTDDVRERFLDASIPNRHAAIHGLVIYSSEKSSLNAIFVAMYVFRVLTVLKPRRLRSS